MTQSAPAQEAGWYRRLFARYYDTYMRSYERDAEPRKRKLFDDLAGTVVEIGAGTGANLRYLPRGCRWIGIEPNAHMHPALVRRAREAGVEPEVRPARAERIDLDDAVADVVVATLVLCSVRDPARVLAEIRRLLRPGGRFVFLEHVAAPPRTFLRGVQTVLRPAWQVFGDGCRLDRDTGRSIREAGFSAVRLEEFRAPGLPWVAPHIAGEAVR